MFIAGRTPDEWLGIACVAAGILIAVVLITTWLLSDKKDIKRPR